jgi:Fe-S-cluster-containing dehydrogenase component
MPRWGLVIDLKKCIGCWSCAISCKQEHFLPPGVLLNRVLIGETGRYPSVCKVMYPVICNHCKNAACVKVCPTGATSQREDGIVMVDPDICMGCRSCLIACPYQMRTYLDHQLDEEFFPGQGLTRLEILGRELHPFQAGTVVKCDMCVEKIDKGLSQGLKPGVNREATPACVVGCPTSARTFGDLDDPQSEIAQLIKKRSGTQLHSEFGTNPSVYYIK